MWSFLSSVSICLLDAEFMVASVRFVDDLVPILFGSCLLLRMVCRSSCLSQIVRGAVASIYHVCQFAEVVVAHMLGE